MKLLRFLRSFAVAASCVGIFVPQVAQADMPILSAKTASTPALAARDIALHDGGVLQGKLLDAQGQPLAGQRVVLGQAGQLVASTQTDGEGRFAFEQLSGGVYQIETARGAGVFRAWAPRTAPPAAQQVAVMITGGDVARGQNGGVFSWLANPWVLAGVVAAAIAIPLALDDDDDQPAS